MMVKRTSARGSSTGNPRGTACGAVLHEGYRYTVVVKAWVEGQLEGLGEGRA
jgi:hypothetical protein